MTSERKNLIKAIYLYFFTGVGLIMFLIGSSQLVRHTTKKVLLPKYYLDYGESRCDNINYEPSPEEKGQPLDEKTRMDKERERCMQKLEEERKYQEVLDLSGAVTLLVLGGGTFIFHYRKTRGE